MGCMHSRDATGKKPEEAKEENKTSTQNKMNRHFSISVSDVRLSSPPATPNNKIAYRTNSLGLPSPRSPVSPYMRRSSSGTPGGSPRHSLSGSTPPSVESFLAKRNNKKRRLPDLPKFGAPLYQQQMRKLQTDTDYKRDSISIKADYKDLPVVLVMLKKYLLKFQGYQWRGVFANGSLMNIDKYHADQKDFVNGYVVQADVYAMKAVIEGNKMDEFSFDESQGNQFYAMIFAELVKLWLKALAQRLLDFLPVSVFETVSTNKQFQAEITKMPEPNLSTFLFVLDICVEVSNNHAVNQMNTKRMAQVVAPYLYKDKNEETNKRVEPFLVRFIDLGINWRKRLRI